MCREDWTVEYSKCRCVKVYGFQMVKKKSCGGCGQPTCRGHVAASRVTQKPCDECIENRKWVKYNMVWLQRRKSTGKRLKKPPS